LVLLGKPLSLAKVRRQAIIVRFKILKFLLQFRGQFRGFLDLGVVLFIFGCQIGLQNSIQALLFFIQLFVILGVSNKRDNHPHQEQ
jgi:hypothetical protein